MKNDISLGQFRNEVNSVLNLHLTRDEPLEPLSLFVPVDRARVVLGASPYIVLCSGSASITLSHIHQIKRSTKGGRKSYKIICKNYADTSDPIQTQFRLYYEDSRNSHT